MRSQWNKPNRLPNVVKRYFSTLSEVEQNKGSEIEALASEHRQSVFFLLKEAGRQVEFLVKKSMAIFLLKV